MNTKRWLSAIGGLVLAAGVALVVTPAAHANVNPNTNTVCRPGVYYPNSGSCDGLDPSQSYNLGVGECSAGAWTVHSESAFGGTLELRWGPDCQTNWTRYTPGNNDEYEIWVTRVDGGAWAGTGMYHGDFFSGDAGVPNYSDQLYVPGQAAACVNNITTGGQVCYTQP